MKITKGMRNSEGGRFLANLELKDQARLRKEMSTQEQMKHFALMKMQKDCSQQRMINQSSDHVSGHVNLVAPGNTFDSKAVQSAASHRLQPKHQLSNFHLKSFQ